MSSGAWDSTTILPGTRAVMCIDLDSVLDNKVADLLGIHSFDQVGFTLNVRDKNFKVRETKQLDLALSDKKPSADYSGKTVYNENGCSIKYIGITDDDYILMVWGLYYA